MFPKWSNLDGREKAAFLILWTAALLAILTIGYFVSLKVIATFIGVVGGIIAILWALVTLELVD